MLVELVLAAVTLIVLGIASYTDLRTKEVPDWLSYGFVFAAIGVRAIYSFQEGWSILLSGLLGLAVFYLLALFFYYTNQWGGGDSKLLMGMGAALGITYPFAESSFTLLWFLLALLLAGGAYGLLWLTVVAFQRRYCLLPEMRVMLGKYKKIHLGVGFASFFLLGTGVFINSLLLILVFIIALYYLLMFLIAAQNCCFIEEKETKHLTEGDWLAEDIVVHGKKIIKKKTLAQEDISKLHKHNISSVLIKEGIPFVPSFLIAYLILLFGKDLVPSVVGRIFG
ncbi:MAG TPA: A24 family peptidase [Candidatus Nanoarchaeia archaeon]|nr:A24 family peptidase [Candidatus Nanoarchaeia archaeon]